jgi:hypothetical protein
MIREMSSGSGARARIEGEPVFDTPAPALGRLITKESSIRKLGEVFPRVRTTASLPEECAILAEHRDQADILVSPYGVTRS